MFLALQTLRAPTIVSIQQTKLTFRIQEIDAFGSIPVAYICDHPTCSQWPCPVMNVVFFRHGTTCQSPTWPSRLLSIPVWMVWKLFFFQNEPLIKSHCSPHFMVNWFYIRVFSWSPICNPPFLIRIATTTKIEQVEIIAISIGFYQLLSFLGLLLYACFYQTQPNSSSGVRWFHAGRRFSQIEEQGVAINI